MRHGQSCLSLKVRLASMMRRYSSGVSVRFSFRFIASVNRLASLPVRTGVSFMGLAIFASADVA
jgi:hypothetical protein